MKTTKVNHSEILNSLKAEFTTHTSAYESASNAWRNSGTTCEDRDAYLLRTMSSIREQLRDLEAQMKFHEIMLQDKKYATECLWTDAHAYEIIEEKSEKVIIVRRMKATIKKEAQKALHDSFVPGGFCGHFDNDLQEWDYESDESNGLETIRKHKDGKWYQAADYGISDYGCGCGVGDGHWNDPSFETEGAAIKFCANYIRDQFLGADPNIKGTKHDLKIIAMLDEIINPRPVQLELFG